MRSYPIQQHGGVDREELTRLGLQAGQVLDFSTNMNPLGLSPKVAEALARVDPSSYPDPSCAALRKGIAEACGVSPEHVLAGNGSTELVHLAARAFLRSQDTVAIFTPTFGEYQRAAEAVGARVVAIPAPEPGSFRWDVERASQRMKTLKPRLVFLCNPNNPTGVYLSQAELVHLLDSLGDAILVVDEAYLSFVDAPWRCEDLAQAHDNVIVVRSMTKAWGMPGVRLGYALASQERIQAMARQQPTWSVSAYAQAAGLAALGDTTHVEQGRKLAREAMAYLERELAALGLRAQPTSANFMLVHVGDAAAVRAALLRRGVNVRDCTSFGLPAYIRVVARPIPECERLLAAMQRTAPSGRYTF